MKSSKVHLTFEPYGLIYTKPPSQKVDSLLSGKAKAFFTNKRVYLYTIVLLAITVAYYIYMEFKAPGYTAIAIHNGVIGRFTGNLSDNHIQPFWYYWNNILSYNYLPWLYFLPISLLLIFFEKDKEKRKFLILLCCLVLFYGLVISLSVNKLSWYDGQLYPILAIITAFTFKIIFNSIVNYLNISSLKKQLFFLILFFTFFYKPTYEIERKNIGERQCIFDECYGKALKQISKKFPDLKTISILHPYGSPHVLYYQTLYNLYQHYHITDVLIEKNIFIYPNSYILYNHPLVTDKLNKYFNYDVLYEYKEVKLVHVKKSKIPFTLNYILDADSLDVNSPIYNTEYSTTGKASICLNQRNPYSLSFDFSLLELKSENISKVHISADIMMKDKLFNAFFVNDVPLLKIWNGINLRNYTKTHDKWYKIDTIIPLPVSQNEQESPVKFYFWHNNSYNLYIDNVKLELLK